MDISSIYRRSEQTSLPARLLPIAMAIVLLALSFSTATELLAETNAGQAKLDRNKVHAGVQQRQTMRVVHAMGYATGSLLMIWSSRMRYFNCSQTGFRL